MIKVRIIRKNKFCYDIRPITFKAILKNKKERIVGSIKFNFIMENVEVDFKRRLSYYEKLAVLKSIFYSFCLNDIKLFRKKINIPIETFLFIDKNEETQEKLSIIEEIMQYNISLFNYNSKKERLIYCIKESYEKIKRGIYINGKEIKLTPVRTIL